MIVGNFQKTFNCSTQKVVLLITVVIAVSKNLDQGVQDTLAVPQFRWQYKSDECT